MSSSTITVHSFQTEGIFRTDPAWLQEYLGLNSFPRQISDADLQRLEKKLLTTRVFRQVRAFIKPQGSSSGLNSILVISVKEKWTQIPVLRAQTGGGTPLLVAGTYNTHTFGRYLTLGGEVQKFGEAPPGAVAYLRAPTLNRNSMEAAAEIWKDSRYRPLYTSDGKANGHVKLSGDKLRFKWLWVLYDQNFPGVKFGPDLLIHRYQQAEIQGLTEEAQSNVSADIGDRRGHDTPSGKAWLLLQYDGIEADNILYDGIRFLFRNGVGIEQDRTLFYAQELEIFWYLLMNQSFNFAAHLFSGLSHSDSLFSRYFFGGFDSVRGLPDGFLSGQKALYGNCELRYLARPWDDLWVQLVSFFDAGYGGNTFRNIHKEQRSCAGFGIRFIIPGIYRMNLRLDYAWSLNKKGEHGFSAGLNHLFQPYRPL